MLFNMMVVITSCAPVRAFKMPGIAPKIAPPTAPAIIASGTWMYPGPSIAKPTHKAVMPPASIWPVAPMLKRPALNATATEIPHKISGVELLMVLEIARNEPNEPTTSAQYALPTVDSAPTMSPSRRLSISDTTMINAPTTSAESTARNVSLSELILFSRSPNALNRRFISLPQHPGANQPCTDQLPLASPSSDLVRPPLCPDTSPTTDRTAPSLLPARY